MQDGIKMSRCIEMQNARRTYELCCEEISVFHKGSRAESSLKLQNYWKMSANKSLSSGEAVNQGFGGVLKRFLSLIVDARQITLSTVEGAELMTETRGNTTPHPEDSHTVLSLTPSFCASIEQSTRLQLGSPKHILTWVASGILMQLKVGSIVVSLLFDENANLGIAEEHVEDLRAVLAPFCVSFDG